MTDTVPHRILVCVGWPYAKTSTHVGQVAGAYLPGDIFARYHRHAGHMVLMVSGSDAHGTPITYDADKLGISPKEFAEGYHQQIVEVFGRLGLSFDLFTITTTENHYHVVQEVFLRLLERGYLFKQTQQAPYCPTDKRFLPDRYINGTCPICGFPDARGDQCDNCGNTLDPDQLIDARCRICGSVDSKIEMRPTEHFFLDLPKLQDQLGAWLDTHTDDWRPAVIKFAQTWIRDGLRPRAITRDLDWGVPIPLEGFDDKRIYVWFDAVIGYLSASIEWAKNQGKPDAWEDFWVPDAEGNAPAESFYFIGKDNIPFHTIIWPAILMGHGDLALPTNVPANEYMTMGGSKASSSRGLVIWTKDALDEFGVDALRYYLAMAAPETKDTDFIYDELIRRNNDELVAAYGNAAHRVLTFVQRHFEGKVPEAPAPRPQDTAMLAAVAAGFDTVGTAIEAVRLREGLQEAMAVAREANRYLDEQAPWKSVKADRESAAATVHTMIQVLNGLKVLFAPYVPHSSQKLHELLGFTGDVATSSWKPEPVPAGQALPVPTPLFAKLEPKVEAEV